jgi:replicative DNA helicase
MTITETSRIIFTPLEASNAAEKYIDWRQENSGGGMPLYIDEMEYDVEKNKGFVPILPGELISIIGRPGNGKTGFMFRYARMRAKWLREQAIAGNEVAANSMVVYVTLEQTVEELRLFNVAAEEMISVSKIANGKMSQDEWDGVKKGLRKLHPIPLWFAGRSMSRRKNKVTLTPENIHASLGDVEKWQGEELKQSIDSVFIDYLQKFRPNGSDFVQYYGNTTSFLKDLAGDYMTRVILGVQAKREVDNRKPQIPLMDDGQWSSTIEQFSDGVISVVRPSHYQKDKEDFAGYLVEGKNQMLVTVLKRKMGPENFSQMVSFQPEYNKLDRLEIKYFKPNEDK